VRAETPEIIWFQEGLFWFNALQNVKEKLLLTQTRQTSTVEEKKKEIFLCFLQTGNLHTLIIQHDDSFL
jgi:hypothetical protein